jgi:hypothetical protein
MDYSGSCEIVGFPSRFRKAPRCSLLRPLGAPRKPDQFSSLGSQSTGSIPLIILGRPLIYVLRRNTYLLGEKLSGRKTGCVVISHKLEKWPLHLEWCSAVQAAHSSCDVLRVYRLEVHRSLPYQETAGASIQVSLYCNQ